MNREIKFRAWDKNKKEMVYSGIEFELRNLEYPSKYGEENKWGSDTIGFVNLNDEYFDIMQYTGLKDKHGKEIYEGDILHTICKKIRYIKKPNVHGLGGETVNEEIVSTVLCEWKNHGFAFTHTDRTCHGFSIPNCEIIGNIHENKTLTATTPQCK